MRKLIALAMFCAIPASALADTATISWPLTATWADGTPATLEEFKWVNIRCGGSPIIGFEWYASVDMTPDANGVRPTSYSWILPDGPGMSCVVTPVLQHVGLDDAIEGQPSNIVSLVPNQPPRALTINSVVLSTKPAHCATVTTCKIDPPAPFPVPRRAP